MRDLHTAKRFVVTAVAILLSSCITDGDIYDDARPAQDNEKVVLSLFTEGDDYQEPTTRGISSNEGKISTTNLPWVLVYKGSDDNATIAEIARAYESGGKTYVKLTKQTGVCQLFIIANPPANVTYGSGTSWRPALNQSHLDDRYGPTGGYPANRVLTKLSEYLRTDNLATYSGGLATSIDYVPYGGANDWIPMTYLHQVTNIDANTTIGGPGNEQLQMKRIVAKLVVNNTEPNFTLLGSTVLNAPNRSFFYRASNRLTTSLETINYIASSGDEVTGISAATAPTTEEQAQGILQTTARNPLYVYETVSSAANKMIIVVKGTFGGQDYYYRLAILDTDGNELNMERNHVYTFTIKSVTRKGYDTFNEALNSTTNSNDAFRYSIKVTEGNMTDILDNGRFYIASTNSELHLYSNRAKTGTGIVAATVNTNAIGTVRRTVRVEGTSIELYSPTPTNGIGTLPNGTSEIKVKLNGATASGTVIINVDDIEKRIPVIRKAIIPKAGQKIQFPGTGYTDKYTNAYSLNVDWIVFSYDGGTYEPGELNTVIYSDDYSAETGGFYMHVEANTLSTPKLDQGVVYLSPLNNKGGRIKLYIDQL